MPKIRKSAILFMILSLASVLIAGCERTLSATPAIAIDNVEQISKVQLHTHRMDKTEYPSNKFENLIKDLESADPLDDTEAKKVSVNDKKMYISLIYEDGKKDIFAFFKWKGKWYLEHDDKLYSNVDFIEDYLDKDSYDALYEDVEKETNLYTPSESDITVSFEYLKLYLEASKNLKQMDMKNYFLFSVAYMQNQGYSKEDAISEEKERLIKNWKVYKMAERLDITPSDDEFDVIAKEWISRLSKAENAKEYESLLEEYHTSWEDIIVKNRNILYYLNVTNELYFVFQICVIVVIWVIIGSSLYRITSCRKFITH